MALAVIISRDANPVAAFQSNAIAFVGHDIGGSLIKMVGGHLGTYRTYQYLPW